MKTWQEKTLEATIGTQLGAILACSLKKTIAPPHFVGSAIVTSDGFIQCSFITYEGHYKNMAFVGRVDDLDENIEELSKHLSLTASEHNELTAAIANWIKVDYRARIYK